MGTSKMCRLGHLHLDLLCFFRALFFWSGCVLHAQKTRSIYSDDDSGGSTCLPGTLPPWLLTMLLAMTLTQLCDKSLCIFLFPLSGGLVKSPLEPWWYLLCNILACTVSQSRCGWSMFGVLITCCRRGAKNMPTPVCVSAIIPGSFALSAEPPVLVMMSSAFIPRNIRRAVVCFPYKDCTQSGAVRATIGINCASLAS